MAVSILPRELKYTYGAFVVGGTSSPGNTRMPYGSFSIREAFGESEVLFSFVISQASEALFVAEAQAVEAAFRIPRQAFTIIVGSTTLKSYSHTGGTGYDCDPAATFAIDDQFASARSRKYDVRLLFRLPATNMSTNGRQSSLVEVDYDASNIRTLTISGTYTASGSNSARTQFESNFAAYASTVRTAFSSNFEQIGKVESTPDTGTDDGTPAYKTLTFKITFRELIASQIGSNLDNSAIVGQRMNLTKSRVSPGDHPSANVRRMVRAQASWSANVDKTVSTNLVAYWNTAYPWIVGQLRSKLSLGAIAVISATPTYNYDSNTISAMLDVEGIDGGGYLEYRIRHSFEITHGVNLTGIATGKKWDKVIDYGPGTIRVTVEENAVEFGTKTLDDLSPLTTNDTPPQLAGVTNAVKTGVPSGSLVLEQRGEAPYQFTVSVWSKTQTWELFNAYGAV